MTFPQASSERDSRTRWLKISAAFWLLLISAVALINSVGLSRLAEQTQSSAQDAQVNALGLRVADLEQQADADKRRPAPISQAEFATARQALDERMTRLEEADEARTLAIDLQTLQAAGWAMQDESGLWRLHTRLIQIATHFAHGIDAARRRLDEVHQRYTRTPT